MSRLSLIGLIVIYVILVFSCNVTSNNEKINVVKEFYSNGNLKSEQEFIQDSIEHGFYRRYYENGQLEIEMFYDTDLKTGPLTAYYRTGEVKCRVIYEKGKMNGKANWFYKNNNLRSQSNYSNGIVVGEEIDYFEDSSIKHYKFYSKEGDLFYVRVYNEVGDLLSIKGVGLTDVETSNLDSLIVGDTLKCKITFATPPNTEQRLFFGELDENDNVVNTNEIGFKQGSNTVYYDYQLAHSGVYKPGILLRITENLTGEKNSYQFSFNDIVIK